MAKNGSDLSDIFSKTKVICSDNGIEEEDSIINHSRAEHLKSFHNQHFHELSRERFHYQRSNEPPRGHNQCSSEPSRECFNNACSTEPSSSCNKRAISGIDNKMLKETEKKVPPTYKRFGYKLLKSMVDTSKSNDIILYLCNNSEVLQNLLKEKLNSDILYLLMQLVVKAIDTEFKESKIEIYIILCSRDFIENLNFHITSLLSARAISLDVKLIDFFRNLNMFFEDMMNVLPSKAVEHLENLLLCIVLVLNELNKKMEGLSGVLNDANKLKGDLEIIKERWENSDKDSRKIKYKEIPPNDFRDLSLYPTSQDLKTKNFLRENIVEGRYDDVYHYLDVQFRLLREDFLDPLRVGIQEFRQTLEAAELSKKKISNIRIYKNVRFLECHIDPKFTDISFTVQLDKTFSSRFCWEYSKRLLSGSLLLFSRDNFETFQLATVTEREVENLKKGNFKVLLVGENIFGNEIKKINFTLAESNAFFEPVYQILKTVQNLPIDKLPMQKYLLVQDISPCHPHYLIGQTLIFNEKMVIPNDESSWPPCASVGFNESQYAAFKSALRNEFVVIQGPPGTGKTYLGLNIVKTLLANVNFDAPILIVCYTNHALDQYLEGLLNVTEDLIRIGRQSKNVSLNRFNYQTVKGKYPIRHPLNESVKSDLAKCLNKINLFNKLQEEVEDCKGILNIYELKQYTEVEGSEGFENSMQFVYWILGRFTEPLYYLMDKYKYVNSVTKSEKKSDIQKEDKNRGEIDEEELFRRDLVESWYHMDKPDIIPPDSTMKVSYILHFDKLNKIISYLENYLLSLANINMSYKKKQSAYIAVTNDIVLAKNILTHFQLKLSNKDQDPLVCLPDLLRCNKKDLLETGRWVLYHYWLKNIKSHISQDVISQMTEYNELVNKWKEIKLMEHYSTLKKVKPKVLGLTTTGAARYHQLLSSLKPAVIIAEEAAEVLEAHILVSLTESCQHLILIGDHKQLKPNPSTYKLAKAFHLDISLFERMIRNKVNCNTLKVQHRMKPNIASLIVPTIYPDLVNHDSVMDYPSILGVKKNLFFIDHQVPEKNEEEMNSRSNPHEASFLIALCRHLILQGYKSSDITVLTTYSSQQFLLRDLKKQNSLLKDVRMTVVDNYQGEESNIILLSLVRSNDEGKVGFIGAENRICVALSRAKHGLYIIGNMNLLKQNSKIWDEINTTLESQEAIGKSLSLVCQIHRDVTEVSCALDFDKIIEGGCQQMCEKLMSCGHLCKSLCHVTDPEHEHIKCFQPCMREICDTVGHTCPLKCFEWCQPCYIIMKRVLPQCSHEADMPCYIKPSNYKCKKEVKSIKPDCQHEVKYHCYMPLEFVTCQTPCNIRLNCGHACEMTCHVNKDPEHLEYQCLKECTRKNYKCREDHRCNKRCWEECGLCNILVKQTLACGHTHDIVCSQNPEKFVCKRDCTKMLSCTHKCKKLCFEPCDTKCKEKVSKIIDECGHEISVACSVDATRSMCKSVCTRKLSCGHPCMLKCSQNCELYECKEYVPSPVSLACGHTSQVPCYLSHKYMDANDDELLRCCQQPCGKELPCKDMCKGTCGNCMQGRIHQVCQEKCGNILICGHKCSVPCRDDCPPCKKLCLNKCSHSKCGRQCGAPCVPCKEKCLRKCKHRKCRKLCGEICDIEPCYENCDRVLKCGHPCVGYCGEPCPPLCRTCNQSELCDVFFGTEEEENARFVMLKDCGHVLESSGLEHWMNLVPEEGKDKEIGVKACPKCKTPIITTLRFGNEVKRMFTYIQAVKKRIFGVKNEISSLNLTLKTDTFPSFQRLIAESPLWISSNHNLKSMMRNLQQVFSKSERTQKCNTDWKYGLNQLKLIQFICIYLRELIKTVLDINEKTSVPRIENLYKKIQVRFDLLLYHLSKRKDKISQMEIDQFNTELRRFKRISEFYELVQTAGSLKLSRTSCIKQFNSIVPDLFSLKQYDYDKEIVEAIGKFAISMESCYEPVAQDEMKMVHEAMKKNFHSVSKQGHWFQCSNGHIYTITECGGAMETGICPECKEVIGGRSHELVSTSSLASQVDGATYAAWSNRNDMHNYRF